MARVKQAPGRYSLHGAREPANGVGRATASLESRTAVAAVRDPNQDSTGPRTERIRATVHTAVDILEWELSHGRISESDCHVGRIVQRVFEGIPPPGSGSNWRGGSRISAIEAQTQMIERYHKAVKEIGRLRRLVIRAIGESGYHYLEKILRDGWTFADMAAGAKESVIRPSEGKITKAGDRFRYHLRDLNDAWAARGSTGALPGG